MQDRNPNAPYSSQLTGWVVDRRFNTLIVAMVSVLLLYMVVPIDSLFKLNFAITRPLKLVLIGISLLMIIWRSGMAWLLAKHVNPFLFLYFALAWASLEWSIEPGETLARLITANSCLAVCLAFALVSWHRLRFQNLLLPALTLLLVASLIYGLLNPRDVIESGTDNSTLNAWKGLALQKNQFGQLSAFAGILWVHGYIAKERKLWAVLFGVTVSLICLKLSKSSTSLLAMVLSCALLLMLQRIPPNLKRYMPALIVIFASVVVFYSLAVLNVIPGLDYLLEPITKLLGRDNTFTGRTFIWEILRDHIRHAPMLGSGYGAYWIGSDKTWSPSQIMVQMLYFYPTQAHNGYLEVLNDLGYLGLSLLGGFLVMFVRQALALFRIDRTQGSLYIALFFMQAVTNLSQSVWFGPYSFEFVIMMFATLSMGRALLDARLREVFSEQPRPPGPGNLMQQDVSPLHWQGRTWS